jgi:aminoglycoside phosphotransferase (APT) family kinase protein
MTTSGDLELGVDLGAVSAWMDEQGLPPGPVERPTSLGGGTQNILVRFDRGGVSYVLRRGPRHLRRTSNDAIIREMRVLSALSGVDVPHPSFIAGCTDTAVLGDAVFYLMEPVDGFNPTVELPDSHRGDDVQHEMGLNAARAAAALAAVDHVAVGLADLGNPDGFLERQVPRWLSDLERYAELDGYDGHQLPAVPEVAAWLTANCPQQWTPGIMHGDFHVANLMYRRDVPAVAAIVDWEMCTIGDPLLDLGWLLATNGIGLNGSLHMPAGEELATAYAAVSDSDLSNLRWYQAMAGFKLGIILEGTNARAHAGLAPKAVGDMLHVAAVALLTQAGDLVNQ